MRKVNKKNQKFVVRGFYNSIVQEYEWARYRSAGGKLFSGIEKSYAIRVLQKSSVLQIGTATGRFTEYLSSRGFHYVGVEIAGAMAKTAHKRLKNPYSALIKADGEILPFRDAVFDNVLSVRSFHFLPNPEDFLKEAYRVLKPKGKIIVSFETPLPFRFLLEVFLPVSQRFYHISQVVILLRKNGFNILLAEKVTKLPIVMYRKAPTFIVRLIKRFHNSLPSLLGTVGSVVGIKMEDRCPHYD